MPELRTPDGRTLEYLDAGELRRPVLAMSPAGARR
jgi:hypothetical protein